MRVASYASGHGLGHATRVCALAECLRDAGHAVFCCSSAPEMAFEGAIAKGAIYRNAKIDASFIQPTAYDVARLQTLENLEAFLAASQEIISAEAAWLKEQKIDLVLVDAPFMPCAASAQAGIPSIIVSNFTFDSCYSYLGVRADSTGSALLPTDQPAEPPLDPKRLAPLVEQTVAYYRCASMVLRLPGAVPMPPFDVDIKLPAPSWVDLKTRSFTSNVQKHLTSHPKTIVDTPLIVRPTSPDVYTIEFRRKLLSRIGIPADLQDASTTHVLLVSFGGQVIPRPRSRQPSPKDVEGANGMMSVRPTSDRPPTALLPPGWIAIVCGTAAFSEQDGFRDDMPAGFFPCVSGIHIPDLTAISDVLLGKLGYGTCSETLATSTPIVYVPRPLFVEEYGLKRLMQNSGTAVELDRTSFEEGFWAHKILEAWDKGKAAKLSTREKGTQAMGEGAGKFIVDHLEAFMQGRT